MQNLFFSLFGMFNLLPVCLLATTNKLFQDIQDRDGENFFWQFWTIYFSCSNVIFV